MESLRLSSNKSSLIGFVFVKNLAYSKKITVKATIDNWNTFIEIGNANYISSNHIFKYSESSVNYDKFSFIVKLNTLCNFKSLMNLQFCIKYETDGKEFWDNNDCKNYQVKLQKHVKKIQPKPKRSTQLDDIGFKLKTNNNFADSFSSETKFNNNKFNFSPRNSKNYLMKKVKSESSLSSLSSLNFASASKQPVPSNPFLSSNNNKTSPSKTAPSSLYSSPVMPSHCTFNTFPLSVGGKPSTSSQDYNSMIEKYCFFGSKNTSPASSATSSPSSTFQHPRLSHYAELSSETPSFCIG
ncbi:unnamed protein product [Ambrosiozyma monospora]|uniref:Unnamed protein product n=1 Tax=Ambrosiozyma monospora TaxID=43982 RepID=A0ACB5SYF8_AMBMO|nr:unnamed protein product [Ambrosiozyma monospora]